MLCDGLPAMTTCTNPTCENGLVPILRLHHGVDNIHKVVTDKANPHQKLLPCNYDKAPCPTCQPEKRAEWEKAEFKKGQKKKK